jgi:dipeptide/tripeptide permease
MFRRQPKHKEKSEMADKKGGIRSFTPLFWLVVVFEFFERGSYYGVMSILSVYLTDKLSFPKEDVGIIKGTIQPILYFLPIVAGALADRFGYRKALLTAFSLLAAGYFLTSQVTSYTAVFLFLVLMALGAGTFKPIISSTIARTTDKENSTLGFGIFYWSINLGAFLFPLILVPYLKKSYDWNTVLIAAAIGTGAMLLPTILLYREPPKPEAKKDKSLIQTLADAFEIVYSPIVLLFRAARGRLVLKGILLILLLAFLVFAGFEYAKPREARLAAPGLCFTEAGVPVEVRVKRDLSQEKPYVVKTLEKEGIGNGLRLEIFRPDDIQKFTDELLKDLRGKGIGQAVDAKRISEMVSSAARPPVLRLEEVEEASAFRVGTEADGSGTVLIRVSDPRGYGAYKAELLTALRRIPGLEALPSGTLDTLFERGANRSFFLLFVGLLLLAAVVLLGLEPRYKAAGRALRPWFILIALGAAAAVLWGLPGLSLFARLVSSVIVITVLSIYFMDFQDVSRFQNHGRFLLLIFLYSGFWVLYFQMFDSVLWYVQAYVDATSLNRFVQGFLGLFGLTLDWRFDVEHVTVINAGTIILLQLLISSIVKKRRALPTMIVGIMLGTIGMAILAVSSGIWVFLVGIIVFSIGEMTAHPKFISYVGQTAPRDRVATYMGYIFLYGVIGSSIGAILGSRLYVRFVDELQRPRTLWLIFSLIGVGTVIALLLYDRFLSTQKDV